MLAKSLWHGITPQNNTEIAPISDVSPFGSKVNCYALHGPNMSSLFLMLDALASAVVAPSPLISRIAIRPAAAAPVSLRCKVPASNVAAALDSTIAEFGLNEVQTSVLRSCAPWLSGKPLDDPIKLVWGVFGSGKSKTLVALCAFLIRALDSVGDKETRVLITSTTNVAVDGVFSTLIERGLGPQCVRVGCIKRISKKVLCRTVTENGNVNAAAELESLLQSDTLSDDERLLVMQAIVDFKSKPRSKSSELKKARIVGCTCASLTKSIMDEQQFDIVIVDEATQLVEPMVLVPCVRFGCKAMILAGDVNQLPPTLAGRTDADAGSKHPMDLSKTLFQRLSFRGLQPIFLNIQYAARAFLARKNVSKTSNGPCRLGDHNKTHLMSKQPSLFTGNPHAQRNHEVSAESDSC